MQHQALEAARNFGLSIVTRSGPNTHFIIYNKKGNVVTEAHGEGCHYRFPEKGIEDGSLIVTGFHPLPSQGRWKVFWDFISNEDISPWRHLVRGCELIIHPNDGRPRAVILDPDVTDAFRGDFIKNFCIALRVYSEYHERFDHWHRLVDNSVDPRDAFYLCAAIFPASGKEGSYIVEDLNNGGHWPLTYPLDFNKFWDGQPHVKNLVDSMNKINACWSKRTRPTHCRFEPKLSGVYKRSIFGRSENVMCGTLEEVHEKFKEWKIKNGFVSE